MDISKLKGAPQTADGQWVAIPFLPGVRLRVRGSNYQPYVDEMSSLSRVVPETDREEDGSLKFSQRQLLLGSAAAKHLLLGWDGLTNDGQPLAFDPDIATYLLTSPECVFIDNSLFAAVEHASAKVARGLGEAVEANVKNSGTPSSGE